MRAGLPLNHPGRWQQHASLRQKATNLQKKNKPAKKKRAEPKPCSKNCVDPYFPEIWI
jgi:hypothetical protein